ncbi:hypothetical protein G3480_25965 [Thiorhodococcus mannitoliphagus]|uniref:Uncharacterized protein n=1 Tax=Thiorhodococcus mannitoliphagus TaxID=329406 RepID=A0A6P1DZN3_9GAMM|nr:hypothetical protein [Thiorhodococcus mannitoliphagus]NEX23678.1 hypothetical protein [Thiorhodococcus mannitoliphagus]
MRPISAKKRQTWLPGLDRLAKDAALRSAFDVDRITAEVLMFQSGSAGHGGSVQRPDLSLRIQGR